MDAIDKINFYLSKKGKNGADLSRALGLSNSIYSQWNTRKTKPSNVRLPAAVSLYAKYPSPANFQSATNAVGIYRAKATGEAAEKVDELSRLIVRECPNCAAVSDQLQAVIECKRKA